MRLLVFAISGLVLAACEHAEAPTAPEEATRSIGADPDSETGETRMSHHQGIEAFAIEAVYKAHPSRALVDQVDIEGAGEGQYLVHIQMTGAEAFRNIYDVTVSESEDGSLDIVEIKQVQGD